MKGGKRPGAGRPKGAGRWGDAETFNMRLPVTVKQWFAEFLQLVQERHLKVQEAVRSTKSACATDSNNQ